MTDRQLQNLLAQKRKEKEERELRAKLEKKK